MARKKIQDDSGLDIEQFGTIFDHLGTKDPADAASSSEGQATQTPPVDVGALLAKIDALSGTVNALASRPTPQPTYIPSPVTSSSPSWDWGDPAVEPEKFSATLAQYTNYVIEQRAEAERLRQEQVAAQSRAANALWEDFSTQYKDYADKQDQIGYAYQRVTSRLDQRGIDVSEYATLNKASLFKAVVDEYDSVFGKPGKPLEESEPDDSNRTSGIFGGIEAGGQPTKGKEPAGDMIKDLKDMQRATGFF